MENTGENSVLIISRKMNLIEEFEARVFLCATKLDNVFSTKIKRAVDLIKIHIRSLLSQMRMYNIIRE